MNKIIGFTFSKEKIPHDDIDVFNVGLRKIEFIKNGLYGYLWGIGDIEKCIINGKYILSFPLSESLLDRNISISFMGENVVIDNDWLGAIPVFYNPRNIIVSTLCLKTLKDKSIHFEGLSDYFEFGYSFLEQTPFSDVKFMRYYSRLIINQNEIKQKYKNDPVVEPGLFDSVEDENNVLKKIKNYINNIESITADEIIIPTSGGYDSRMLNICIKDKSRIRSFTYGISKDQSQSYEVIHAKKVSEVLGTKWQQVKIGQFNDYLNEWFRIYGFSSHLHGMYHIEFYKKIIEQNDFSKDTTLLSGIVGDAWTGNVEVKRIGNHNELVKISYSHGLNAEKHYLIHKSDDQRKRIFFRNNFKVINHKKISIIFLIRFKLILLSFLTQIPEYFGFPVWTPFLEFDNVISILNIKDNRRKNRLWQKEFFQKYGLDMESMKLKRDKTNDLDYDSSINFTFEPLDVQLLQKIIEVSYLEKINGNLEQLNKKRHSSLFGIFTKRRKNSYLKKFYAYCTIKSFENALKI